MALEWLLSVRPIIPIFAYEPFTQELMALTFGLAALWLWYPCFARAPRFLAFLGTLLTVELFGLSSVAVGLVWCDDTEWGRILGTVAAFGAVLSVAFHLAGWSCRARFSRRRFSLWLGLWIIACLAALLFAISMCLGGGPIREMTVEVLGASVTAFCVLLPYLMLSFANGFFRQRLVAILRLAACR
jgi:hypothetical protein